MALELSLRVGLAPTQASRFCEERSTLNHRHWSKGIAKLAPSASSNALRRHSPHGFGS